MGTDLPGRPVTSQGSQERDPSFRVLHIILHRIAFISEMKIRHAAAKESRKHVSADCASRRPWKRGAQQRRSAADNAGNQTRTCFLSHRKRYRFRVECLWLRLFRYDADHQAGDDADRGADGSSTLTCYFFRFRFLALAEGLLTSAAVQLYRKAPLVGAVGLAALLQACPMTTGIVVVALTTITGAADVENFAAFWTSTYSLPYFECWQGARAFPKAGLDNRRQSWQAMKRTIRMVPLIGSVRRRPQPVATVGAFLFPPPEENKPTTRNEGS